MAGLILLTLEQNARLNSPAQGRVLSRSSSPVDPSLSQELFPALIILLIQSPVWKRCDCSILTPVRCCRQFCARASVESCASGQTKLYLHKDTACKLRRSAWVTVSYCRERPISQHGGSTCQAQLFHRTNGDQVRLRHAPANSDRVIRHRSYGRGLRPDDTQVRLALETGRRENHLDQPSSRSERCAAVAAG